MPAMRGDGRQPDSMFCYVSAAQRVPPDHPLRAIRALVDDVLLDMSPSSTASMPRSDAHRFRPNDCCARSCFKSSIRFAASDC
jgi:hypothetical protein